MAKESKKTLPASGAGLVRYFNDENYGIELSPTQVVIGVVLIMLICIALRFTTNVAI